MASDLLVITIPPEGYYYSLYADGLYAKKTYEKETDMTSLYYERGAAVFLYYTYPTHRRVYLVRNSGEEGEAKSLPGVSKKVSVIFKQYASRVDKTKRAVSYLNTHYQSAYGYSDKFYTRLSVILLGKGKIDYTAIDALCEKWL
jgi:hypothetical protein